MVAATVVLSAAAPKNPAATEVPPCDPAAVGVPAGRRRQQLHSLTCQRAVYSAITEAAHSEHFPQKVPHFPRKRALHKHLGLQSQCILGRQAVHKRRGEGITPTEMDCVRRRLFKIPLDDA